jgi:hypothetical protein
MAYACDSSDNGTVSLLTYDCAMTARVSARIVEQNEIFVTMTRHQFGRMSNGAKHRPILFTAMKNMAHN